MHFDSPSSRSTTFSKRVVREACFGSLVFLFYKDTQQITHLGERNSKSNIQILHVLAQLHLHVSWLFVHGSMYILSKCI